MLDSAILDVAIGLTLAFTLISTLCAAIREAIEQGLKTRAAYLERAIREMLHDRTGEQLARSLYEHPLVYGLYRNGYRPGSFVGKLQARGGDLPSYIPARTFALALMDLAARGQVTDAASGHPDFAVLSLQSLRANVVNLQSPPVQRVLLTTIDSAQGSLDAVRQGIEAWYDGAMERASGWYKRFTQKIIFAVALLVAIVLNLNTITIAHRLYVDETLRKSVVAAAGNMTELPRTAAAASQLGELGIPIGWADGWGAPIGSARRAGAAFDPWNDLAAPILGLLLTAVAAMLGAPFWFDVLKRFVVIRATVKPSDKPHERPSGDASLDLAREPAPVATARAPAAAAAPARAAPPEGDFDGCGRSHDEAAFTSDEDLPAARGGVAP